jgi:predicted ATP-grasp superfamily ATP-dependent carboligase
MVLDELTTPVFVLGEGITALSLVQSLGRFSIPVYLLGSGKSDIAYYSRYATAIDQIDVGDSGQIIDRLRETAISLRCKPVLLCCSDFFLQMISTHRDEILKFCYLNLPSTEGVATVLDKGIFGDFCASHELPAPRSWTLDAPDQFEKCQRMARFPVVIKPIFAHRAKAENFQKNGQFVKMILARDVIELRRYHTELTGYGARILAQEYIEGPDHEHYSYVSYRDSDSKEIAGIGLRKMRVSPIHAGVGTFVEIAEDVELAAISSILLDKLNYKGISSVCFKRDIRDGKLMVHEVNGRFPQVQSGSQLCGINLPYVAYQDALGQKVDIERVSHENKKLIFLRLDIDSFRQYRRLGELSALDWLKSLWQVRVCAEFAWDDLRPFLFFMIGTVRRKCTRISS